MGRIQGVPVSPAPVAVDALPHAIGSAIVRRDYISRQGTSLDQACRR